MRTSWASFSNDRLYRYDLHRVVGEGRSVVTFVMLNPSTADETSNDPTVKTCIRYAQKWNYGRLTVVNIFAYRSTDPRELYELDDPIGTANDSAIRAAARVADLVVCAWGTHGKLLKRGEAVRQMLNEICEPHVLELTKEGHPHHPLYLKENRVPIAWD